MSFYCWSSNYLSQLPSGTLGGGQHLAAGTRMNLGNDWFLVQGQWQWKPYIYGIGMAMGPGYVSQGGCGPQSAAAEVEVWTGLAGTLQPSSCSGSGQLSDGVYYKITIGSNDAGYIYYEVREVNTNLVVASYSYLSSYTPPFDRLFVTAVSGEINPPWAVSMWGLQYGWY
jgi:hypothetical protein